MQYKQLFLLILFLLAFESLTAQSFYREKEPKTFFYLVGLGGGTFFAAPRPSYDSIINKKMPVFSIGLGKRLGEHLMLKSNFSFQPISSKEAVLTGESEYRLDPVFQGYSYAFDLVPTFSLLPSYHHMSRPVVDLHLGVGVGYLVTYRTETFTYEEKRYDFSFFESSLYLPVKGSVLIKLGILSDLVLEGSFFYTFLDGNREGMSLKKEADHFGQLNLMYRRFIR